MLLCSQYLFFRRAVAYAAIAAIACAASWAYAQGSQTATPQIAGRINASEWMVLPGNVRTAALEPANDRGAVDSAMPLEHMLLEMQRTPEREAALDGFLAVVNDGNSPLFHKWLSAQQIGEDYGPAAADIAKVKRWLTAQGFMVNGVSPNGMTIDFSGTAGQVTGAFHTSMHHLLVQGEAHVANMQNPSLPAAFAGVVAGVVTLNDFRPHALHRNIAVHHFDPRTGSMTSEGTAVTSAGAVHPEYSFTSGAGTYEAVVPGDLATIYNLTPVFQAGYSGQGQIVVVIEDSDVYSAADWTRFREVMGLSQYTSGSLYEAHPNCTDPGVNGDDGEAILDAEWASAAAPSALIAVAACADTATTFGGLIALNNVISLSNPPKIVSISYGEAESENGATANLAYKDAYQSAAAEGISVFVSAGDEGGASGDANAAAATHGISVSGFASTPYNVAVGGTDFGDTYAGSNATYWNATNTSNYASAKGYIPEIPWNDSCASQLLASKLGYNTTYGTNGLCNSATGEAYYLTTGAGSGGPSGCATGTPSAAGIVSGSCKGYAKPSFQSGLVGNPTDGVRDIPDVSLFAANGVWGHYYVYCYSDLNNGGSSCAGAPSTWSGAGGTSFASPIMASIQSLINQAYRSAWGNPDATYYNLARLEYGSSGNTYCNATNGNGTSSQCAIYDVTEGDIDVNCTGTNSCYQPSGANGVLSTVNSEFAPAYASTIGWDFATGIGTINAANLAIHWNAVSH